MARVKLVSITFGVGFLVAIGLAAGGVLKPDQAGAVLAIACFGAMVWPR